MAKGKLSDIAYEKIKDLIQSGVYSPGMTLPETELSKRLEISRTPIREALQRLSEDMIVTITPHLGAMVSTFDLNQLRDLYETREAVEGMMARLLCAPSIPTAPIESLMKEYEDAMKIQDTEERHKILDSINNNQYKQFFSGWSPNKMLIKLYTSIDAKVGSLHKICHIIPIYPDVGTQERIFVLKAILEKNPDKAEHMARTRIQWCLKRILDNVMPNVSSFV